MKRIAAYVKYCENFEGKSEKTIVAYVTDITQFKKFIMKDFSKANTGDVINWISSMDVAGSTKKRKIKSLSSFYKYLINIAQVDMKNPIVNINVGNIKQENLLPKYMSKEDVTQLMGVITKIRDRLILDVLLNTGIRLGELTSLNIEDILDAESMIIYGKGNKERKVYFNKRLQKSMKDYVDSRDDDCEALFINMYSERLSDSGVQKMFSKYLKRAELEQKEYSVHSTRHTYATQMLNNGVPITTVSKLLGHADLKTTQVYAKVMEETTEGAGKAFDVFG